MDRLIEPVPFGVTNSLQISIGYLPIDVAKI